jgi:hypothetical protein
MKRSQEYSLFLTPLIFRPQRYNQISLFGVGQSLSCKSRLNALMKNPRIITGPA